MRACARFVVLGFAVVLAVQAGAAAPRFVAAPGSPIRVGKALGGVAAGDLDRDGKADLVVAVGGTSSLTILLGRGGGRFAPAPGAPLPVAAAPHLVEIGDFDRDGRPDLVATSHDSHGVFVWLGDGAGRFTSAARSPYPALAGGKPHNHGLALGDVDRDGTLDVVTTDDEAHVVAVLLGDGRGGFRPAKHSPFGVGRQPYPPALGDSTATAGSTPSLPTSRAGRSRSSEAAETASRARRAARSGSRPGRTSWRSAISTATGRSTPSPATTTSRS